MHSVNLIHGKNDTIKAVDSDWLENTSLCTFLLQNLRILSDGGDGILADILNVLIKECVFFDSVFVTVYL